MIYNIKGVVCFKTGGCEAALKALNISLELDDKYAESYYYRGLVYAKLGDWKNATDDYMTAVELDPKYTYDPESRNK